LRLQQRTSFDTASMENGREIEEGLQHVEGLRASMDLFSTALKKRRESPAHGPLAQLLDKSRAALRRSQQHFLNMMLLPTLGHGYHKVDLHFACRALRPRQITVSVRPKDGGGLRMSGAAHLRHL